MSFSRPGWSFKSRHFGLGLVIGAGGAAVYYSRKQSEQRVPDLIQHKALKYGAPSVDRLRFHEDFVISFDTRTKTPEWVLEHVSWTDQPRVADRKNVEFKEDLTFEDRFRSHLKDYRGSGYDRGHMAPAANHKGDQMAMDSTFLLTNICPQVGKGFNRDYWARFERFANQLTRSCDEVFIVSGPLYLPHKADGGFEMRHSMLGQAPRLVSVPTHFFKVILGQCKAVRDEEPTYTLGAFVMPNSPIDSQTALTAFAVPLYQLEAVSGLHFFPGLVSKSRQAFHDRVALLWQKHGRHQLQEQQCLRLKPSPSTPLLSKSHTISQSGAASTQSPDVVSGGEVISASTEFVGGRPSLDLNIFGEKTSAHQETPGLHNDVCTAAPLLRTSSVPPEHLAEIEGNPDNHISESFFGGPEALDWSATKDNSHPLGAIKNNHSAAILGTSQDGIIHICDHTKCSLPPGDWYLKKKAALEGGVAVGTAPEIIAKP